VVRDDGQSVPNLGDCADDWPDGPVVTVDPAPKRCANLSRAVVGALPDAAGCVVLPTGDGFRAARRGAACLVLGRRAATGGEVGRFRALGNRRSSDRHTGP
jgi:hypothetical protein